MKTSNIQRAASTNQRAVKGLAAMLRSIAELQQLLLRTVSLEEFLAARKGLMHAYVELTSYSLHGTNVTPPKKRIAAFLAQLPALDEQFLERYLNEYRSRLAVRETQEEEGHDGDQM